MSLTHTNLVASAARSTCRLFLAGALLASALVAQANQSNPTAPLAPDLKADVSDALGRLRQGDFSRADIVRIAESGRTGAIPDLKKQFDLTQDDVAKHSIASALVRLGDNDPARWWDYLVKGATDAIASDVPSPARFDSAGKLMHGLSPEFVAWGKAHNLSTDDALELAMINLPAHIVFLGQSGDPRAIPLLRQALSSSNYMIQASAAMALAGLRDKASIPLIIQACRQAPSDAALVIARALVDFDDPEAQNAAKAFRPAKEAK